MKPIELTRASVKKMLRPRQPDSRKGQNGRLLIVGGSGRYYGSPALVAKAACRAGADLVYLLVPDKIAPVIASYSPDFIVWSYEGDRLNERAFSVFDELAAKTDAMVIGNGLTKDAGVLNVAGRMAQKWSKPLVIDADCIGAVWKKGAIYTPHVVEFQRMRGVVPSGKMDERCEQVADAAKRVGGAVLLKGVVDVIADADAHSARQNGVHFPQETERHPFPESSGKRTPFHGAWKEGGRQVALNRTGNAGMTCGGTGDTLAGICGALLARRQTAFEAACIGAHLNGLAGDIAYKELGYSLMASDLIERIPRALKYF